MVVFEDMPSQTPSLFHIIYKLATTGGIHLALDTVIRVKNHISETMLRTQNGLSGVGVGYLDIDDPQKGYCIILYQEHDQDTEEADCCRDKVTECIKEVCAKLQASPVAVRSRYACCFSITQGAEGPQVTDVPNFRAIQGGDGIGPGGTMGLVCEDIKEPGSRYLLSNKHVW
jgi:hypothetical protein